MPRESGSRPMRQRDRASMSPIDWAACAAISIFIWIGLVLIGVGFRNIWYALATTRWPTVPGVVLESGASTKTAQGSQGEDSTTFHVAEITFSYEVKGSTYTTQLIHFGQVVGTADPADAELRRLRYPAGAQVMISYNPSNPSMAVARPGFHTDALWLPGAGLGFGLPGLMFLLLYLSMAKGFAVRGYGWRLFAGIFLLFGVWLLLAGGTNLQRARESLHWPTAPGVILAPRQDPGASAGGNDEGYVSSGSTGIIYKYMVGGKKYFSHLWRFGQLAFGSTDFMKDTAERYQGGAKVRVAYDPSDPEIAVLEPGIDSQAYWLPGAGAACVVFALAVLLLVRRLGM
jgi:hypothetical protein